jgi:hypothetical protein
MQTTYQLIKTRKNKKNNKNTSNSSKEVSAATLPADQKNADENQSKKKRHSAGTINRIHAKLVTYWGKFNDNLKARILKRVRSVYNFEYWIDIQEEKGR